MIPVGTIYWSSRPEVPSMAELGQLYPLLLSMHGVIVGMRKFIERRGPSGQLRQPPRLSWQGFQRCIRI